MLIKPRKLFIAFVLFCFFIFPSVAIAQTGDIPVAQEVSQNNQTEIIEDSMHVEDSDIEPINTNKLKQTVVPDPSKEGKKVVGLFLKTMMAVLLCTIILYFILLFVKKFYYNGFYNQDSEELDNLDLSTPNSRNDALKSFLNRTK